MQVSFGRLGGAGIMRWHMIALLLACVLFPSSVINAARRLSAAGQAHDPEISKARHRRPLLPRSRGGEEQAVLVEKAEMVAQKAAALREKQATRNLVAASRLSRESSRLFAAGHSYDKAADSQLQMGEIYLILSE